MTDLVEFLRARLDEDERIARGEITRREVWQSKLDQMRRFGEMVGVGLIDYDELGAPGDPARVLVEVETKRWIIDALVPEVEDMDETIHQEFCGAANPDAHNYIAAQLLQRMAQIYADHPDYDPAWAPEPVEP